MKDFCTIYLVRHGETDWNIKSLIQGHTDISLNKKGHEQANQLAGLLDHVHFDAVYSSDLIRARHTAETVAKKDKVKIEVTDALRERYFGVYEGKSFKKYDKKIVSLLSHYSKTVYTKEEKTIIETDEAIMKRLIPFMKKIAKKHIGKNVLMVSHGGTMRCFLIHLGFATYKTLPPGTIKNLGYVRIRADGESFIIEKTSGIAKNR
jgi:broad specificity phosphatase PhoE